MYWGLLKQLAGKSIHQPYPSTPSSSFSSSLGPGTRQRHGVLWCEAARDAPGKGVPCSAETGARQRGNCRIWASDLPLPLWALERAKGPAVGRTRWQHGAGKILKRSCVLIQNLIFLDWCLFEHLSLIFLILILPEQIRKQYMLCAQLSACQANTGSGNWGGLAGQQRAGKTQQATALGTDTSPPPTPSLQPGTPENHLEPADTGHKSSPCKITAFIKIANTCLEQLLNITQHQRAADETTEIPAPSPESRGQRGRSLQHHAHLQAVIPAEVQQLGTYSRKNSKAVTFTTHTGLTTFYMST